MRVFTEIRAGRPFPLGVHVCCDGTNFALFSRHATRIELCIFSEDVADSSPLRFMLDPTQHRTGDIWHALIHADLTGRHYAFRAIGPDSSGTAIHFDRQALLLDPYARIAVASYAPEPVQAGAERNPDLSTRFTARIASGHFDWQDVRSPQHAWADTILYETHVRGFTIHPSSASQHRGQYLGILDKIPYLRSLGITALELLPVQTFNPRSIGSGDPKVSRTDYWGYNPIALFAPHPAYSSDSYPAAPLIEFKTMVRELHRAGIEVILDVVFNHSGEGGADGPVYSYRGLDNAIYYLLAPDGSRYLDYTGCGNTLNCNHPVVRSMILDCLRHWVIEMHVDGFRFDLAAVLGRGRDGALLSNPPILEEIAEDPILRTVKLIAEAWDSGGAFQVGGFAGPRWGEWNCHFRDEVRRFWRGDPGFNGRLALRLCGSADLYEREQHSPLKSVNFLTSHDGFTLQDLVSYSVKHNEANGEGNCDGLNENYTENHGIEGPTSNASIRESRERQIKNLLGTLLLSRGVPMVLGGDEFGRTQRGNNNAWCQDNELSWYDWGCAEEYAQRVRFVTRLIALRKAHLALRADRFYSSQEIVWLGPDGHGPDWNGAHNVLGCIVACDSADLVLLFNATANQHRFILPRHDWHVLIDTARRSPDDAPDEPFAAQLADSASVWIAPHSLLVLRAVRVH